MNSFLKNAWSDVKKRRYLELYITLAVAISIFLASILGLQNSSVIFAIILASLAVLIYGLIDSRHIYERMEEQLDVLVGLVCKQQNSTPNANDFFLSKKPLSNETFRTANTILLLGYSLSRTVREYHDVLGQRLVAGASIRVIILDPENETLLKMAALESTAAPRDYWHNTVSNTKQLLKELSNLPGRKGKIEVGYLPYSPSFGLVMIEPNESHGFIFVDIYHHKSTAPNATFKLRSAVDGSWYEFFKEQYEKLWQSCRIEDFTDE
ncbi:hypothetical protein VU00_11063 [Candidatus Electrothrix marina]|uniref:Uncharacterized protein n=1 Tax=Candidatus Electrothrix marina TaxID=1859130 RepID=A0A444JB18_9BACT|nr:hypothetical protein VU00_11063 [Candidatus Electrothrix marina]